MQRIIEGFWKGFTAPLRAAALILRSPGMLALIAIPLSLNTLIYIAFFHYGSHFINHAMDDFLIQVSAHWPRWLLIFSSWSLHAVSWLALTLVALFTFTFMSGTLSAPFNDALSRKTMRLRLKEKLKPKMAPFEPAPPFFHSHRIRETVALELKRMSILVIGAISALILGFVPLMQLPALILGGWLVAFEYFGYPIAQRSSRLSSVFSFILRHPAIAAGFGSFLLILMAIPLASILYIPLAVVAGSSLYIDLVPPDDLMRAPASVTTHRKI